MYLLKINALITRNELSTRPTFINTAKIQNFHYNKDEDVTYIETETNIYVVMSDKTRDLVKILTTADGRLFGLE